MSDATQLPAIVLAREPAFALGRLEVRPATREVAAPDFRDVLEPRVMQVLVCLARARGQVIARDELAFACWDGRVVGEDAINRVISRLRRLSERDAGASFKLETITRVGYRLAAIEPVATAGPARTELTLSGPPLSPARRHRRGMLALCLGAVVLAAAAFFLWQAATGPMPADAQANYDQALAALRKHSGDDVSHALELLQRTVAEAPDVAAGWSLLAHAYYASLEYTPPDNQAGVTTRAAAALDRARALDPDDAQAKVVEALLGGARGHVDLVELDRLQVRGLAAVPDDDDLLRQRLSFSMRVGLFGEAVAVAERAAAVRPDYARAAGWRAAALARVGRMEESDRVMAEAMRTWPRNKYVYFTQYWTDLFFGRPASSLALIADLNARPIGVTEDEYAIYGDVAAAFVDRSPDRVSRAIAQLRASALRGVGFALNAIPALAALGDLDGAFAVAASSKTPSASVMFSRVQGEYSWAGSLCWTLLEPQAAAMRRDARFVPLLESLGLGDYWRKTGRWPDFCAEDGAAEVCAQLKAAR